MLALALAIVQTSTAARTVPSSNGGGLDDQKNFISYSGVGGYSGIGNDGLPFGGVGAAAGMGGGLGGGGMGSFGGAGAGGVPGVGVGVPFNP